MRTGGGWSRVKKFVCPLCSEVSCSSDETVVCRVCGERMTPIDGCLYVCVPDRPGELANFLKAFAEKEINVTAMRVITRRSNEAHVLFSVDKVEAALAVDGVKHAEDVDFLGKTSCLEL